MKVEFLTGNDSIIDPNSPVSTFSIMNNSITNPSRETPKLKMIAQTCSLNLCLQNYDVHVTSGIVSVNKLQETSDVWTLPIYDQTGSTSEYLPGLCWSPQGAQLPNASTPTSPEDWEQTSIARIAYKNRAFCDGREQLSWHGSWTSGLGEKLVGSINATADQYDNLTVVDNISVITPGTDYIQYGEDSFEYLSDYTKLCWSNGISKIMTNLATSLNRLSLDATANTSNAAQAHTGAIGMLVAHMRVRGIWLTLSIALCIGTIIFLVATIIASARSMTPLWKSSVDVLFYHGLEGGDAGSVGLGSSLTSITEMRTRSEVMIVRLAPDEKDARLVLVTT